MKNARRTTPREEPIETAAELARRIGRNPGTVSRWLRRRDWPFARRGPWPASLVAKVAAWAAGSLQEDRAAADDAATDPEASGDPEAPTPGLSPERAAKLAVLVERAAAIKLDRELKLGLYVSREDVERDNVAKVLAVRAAMGQVPHRARDLVGRSEEEIRDTLEGWMRRICNAFAAGETPTL